MTLAPQLFRECQVFDEVYDRFLALPPKSFAELRIILSDQLCDSANFFVGESLKVSLTLAFKKLARKCTVAPTNMRGPLLGNVKPMLSHDGQDFSRVVKCFLSNLIVPDNRDHCSSVRHICRKKLSAQPIFHRARETLRLVSYYFTSALWHLCEEFEGLSATFTLRSSRSKLRARARAIDSYLY